jgi:hypothetical protein
VVAPSEPRVPDPDRNVSTDAQTRTGLDSLWFPSPASVDARAIVPDGPPQVAGPPPQVPWAPTRLIRRD